MGLQIQMLGTGSAFSKKYFNNNALVTCNGTTLMIDCGFTGPRALYELQIPLTHIQSIFITHIHADHVGGLEEVAFRSKYESKKRVTLYVPNMLVDLLWNTSLKGGLHNPAEGMNTLDDYFDVVPVDPALPFTLPGGLTVELFRTEHIPGKPSYSLLLNNGLFYSSDSKFNLSLLESMHHERKCEAIWHDCQFTHPGTVHASLEELLTLPEDIQRKVMLMHYDDRKDQFAGKTGRMTLVDQHRVYDYPSL